MTDGKDWLNRVLWRLIEDGTNYRVQRYQDEWEDNFEARMCIANILKNWERDKHPAAKKVASA